MRQGGLPGSLSGARKQLPLHLKGAQGGCSDGNWQAQENRMDGNHALPLPMKDSGQFARLSTAQELQTRGGVIGSGKCKQGW